MPEQPLKLNEELVNQAKEMSSDENKDNQIEPQELEPKDTLNLLCEYVDRNGIADISALNKIDADNWWGYHGKIREGKEFEIDDGNIQLNIDELVFRPRWSKARKPFSLAKDQHIIVIDLETKQDDDEKLQNIRIKYFYYLCKKLREHTNKWNISVQDEPSTTPNAEGRRMLKIFFGNGITGTSDDNFRDWIKLFDEIYEFLAEHQPSAEDLNTIQTPDYTAYGSICGSLDDTFTKDMNTNNQRLCCTLDKISKEQISKNINGAIALCGVVYLEKQLFCYPSNKNGKYFCDALRWIRAGIATFLSDSYGFERIKEYFDLGVDAENTNSLIFKIKNNEIRITTNANLHDVLRDAIMACDNFSAKKDQFKLVFNLPEKKYEDKWKLFESLVGKENILPYNGKLESNTPCNTPCNTPDNSQARNRIIFGAPGTGKSNRLKMFLKNNPTYFSKFERVTFHPEYSYYDFVGTYRPCMNEAGDKIIYQFEPGPFARILKLARKRENTGKKFLLVIEEINRARTAAVFGDTFQLLDRDEYGESEYEIMPSRELCGYLLDKKYVKDEDMTPIRIPSNMYIWATMNSADQGVYSMDTAFKRRWDFEYLNINNGVADMNGEFKDVWNDLRMKINGLLRKAKINEDKQMGPFFIKTEGLDESLFVNIFKNKVLMYIYEDAAKHKKRDVFVDENKTYSELCTAIDVARGHNQKIGQALASIFKGFEPLPEPEGGADHDEDSEGENEEH